MRERGNRCCRNAFFGVMAATLLATLAAPGAAGTLLTFDVTSHTERANGFEQSGGSTVPADANYSLSVMLSGDTLRVDEPDETTLYDFKHAHVIRINKAKKSYQDYSLYALVGIKIAEFANRMMMGRVLAAAKLKGDPMSPALTENFISLSDPENGTVIDRSVKGDQTTYSWNGQLLMAISQATRDVSPAVLSQYLRFLRYSTGGHPQILADIERGHGVPEHLTIVRSHTVAETRTLTLRGIDERPDSPVSVDGYTREIPTSEPFTTLNRLTASSAADLFAHARTLVLDRDAAVAEGKILDAMLANFALSLSTGNENESSIWLAAHRDEINADADAQTLIQNVQPKNADSARAAVDAFEKLKRSAGPHGYVLNIFEGNIRFGLHQAAVAIDLLLAALAADPTVTAAWIDLGGMYYSGLRPDAAWACWNAARTIRPTHFMLKIVDDRERQLRTDHPEFF